MTGELGVGPKRKTGARRRKVWPENFSPENILGSRLIECLWFIYKIFLGISFVSHGYFLARKFLELAPSRSLGSPKLPRSTNF